MGRLSGKRAFVTAAGQGIGRATVEAMAREGARVIATDLDAGKLDGLDAETFALDVTDAAAIAEAAERSGAPDVLFNCAGHVAHGTILDCSEAEWDRSIALNMTAMYRVLRVFLPGMIERGGGSVVNMSSVVSSLIAAPDRFVYGATKAGVIGITKSVAADFVGQGIRCNAVCPGTVETPSLHDRIRARGDFDEVRAAFVARQPMGRIATAEEVAHLVVFLASDEASYVTGAAFVADGGWSNV